MKIINNSNYLIFDYCDISSIYSLEANQINYDLNLTEI